MRRRLSLQQVASGLFRRSTRLEPLPRGTEPLVHDPAPPALDLVRLVRDPDFRAHTLAPSEPEPAPLLLDPAPLVHDPELGANEHAPLTLDPEFRVHEPGHRPHDPCASGTSSFFSGRTLCGG